MRTCAVHTSQRCGRRSSAPRKNVQSSRRIYGREKRQYIVLSPDTHSAADVIRLLALEPLPHEGGWFRRLAESRVDNSNNPAAANADVPADPAGGSGARCAWSSVYALFTPDSFSALHCLTSDEIWCFHAGDPLDSLRLYQDGVGERVSLGLDPGADQRAQDVVRSGTWQGTRLQSGGRWALVSCVVVPEFSWDGFRLGARTELVDRYPKWKTEIEALTRDGKPKAGKASRLG